MKNLGAPLWNVSKSLQWLKSILSQVLQYLATILRKKTRKVRYKMAVNRYNDLSKKDSFKISK
jgi:hypothetical protein